MLKTARLSKSKDWRTKKVINKQSEIIRSKTKEDPQGRGQREFKIAFKRLRGQPIPGEVKKTLASLCSVLWKWVYDWINKSVSIDCLNNLSHNN